MSNYDGKISLPEQNVANNVANGNSQHLTEQWRNGTLEEDFYYVKNKSCLGVEIDYYNVLHSGIKYWSGCEDEDVEEVLAPVPDYMDCKRLMNDSIELDKAKIKIYELVSKNEQLEQDNKYLKSGIETRDKQIEQLVKQLEIATKALKKINRKYRFTVAQDVVYKALKEMKGLK